jgi:hypothetical protein
MARFLLEKSDELLLTKPKEALDVSIMDRRGRNATAIAVATEHHEVVEVIEEYTEKIQAKFDDVKAQLEELRKAGRTDMTMDDFIEKAKAEILEESGEGGAAAEGGAAEEAAAEAKTTQEEPPAAAPGEEVVIDDDDEGSAAATEGGDLDAEEQAMLEKLLAKGYKIEKKPDPDEEAEKAMLEKLAKKGYVVTPKSRPAGGAAAAAAAAATEGLDDEDLEAEINRRAAGRQVHGSASSGRGAGAAAGGAGATSTGDPEIDAELQRRLRAKQEL